MTDAPHSPRLRVLAYLEGLSFLVLLLGAVPLKHLAGWPVGVRVVGPIHGFLFLAYIFGIAGAVFEDRWTIRTGLLAVGASFLPFGPFVLEARLQRSEARTK